MGRLTRAQPIRPIVTDPELAENFSKSFTDLPLSPVVTRGSKTFDDYDIAMKQDPYAATENNPFGGFSFVASQSLLDGEDDLFMLDG